MFSGWRGGGGGPYLHLTDEETVSKGHDQSHYLASSQIEAGSQYLYG